MATTSRCWISASHAYRTSSLSMNLNRRRNSANRRSAVFDHGRRNIAIELHSPANEPLRFRDGNAEVHVARTVPWRTTRQELGRLQPGSDRLSDADRRAAVYGNDARTVHSTSRSRSRAAERKTTGYSSRRRRRRSAGARLLEYPVV